MIHEEKRDAFLISTDPARLDVDAIYDYLSRVYWANTRSRDAVERSLKNSLCFGLYEGASQIGLARVISDYATFAYVCDVYVLEAYQGNGLGTWLMKAVMAYPDLQGLRRWLLATRDAHGLYRKSGFKELESPERWMEILATAPSPPSAILDPPSS
jgi:GNAT superfamily N-acetyltransferase